MWCLPKYPSASLSGAWSPAGSREAGWSGRSTNILGYRDRYHQAGVAVACKKAGKIATDDGRMGQLKGMYQDRIRVLHWHPAACMQGNTSRSQLPSPNYLAAQHHKAATSSYTSKCRIQIGRKVVEGIRSSLEWYGNHGDITAGFFPADLRYLRILGLWGMACHPLVSGRVVHRNTGLEHSCQRTATYRDCSSCLGAPLAREAGDSTMRQCGGGGSSQ